MPKCIWADVHTGIIHTGPGKTPNLFSHKKEMAERLDDVAIVWTQEENNHNRGPQIQPKLENVQFDHLPAGPEEQDKRRGGQGGIFYYGEYFSEFV